MGRKRSLDRRMSWWRIWRRGWGGITRLGELSIEMGRAMQGGEERDVLRGDMDMDLVYISGARRKV